MESRTQPSPIPKKSSSFSSTTTHEDKRLRETNRNLSLDSKFNRKYEKSSLSENKPGRIDEEGEEENDNDQINPEDETSLATLYEDIDHFISTLRDSGGTGEIPDTVGVFIKLVEKELIRYESSDDILPHETEQATLSSIQRLSNLVSALELSSGPKHFDAMRRASGALHHAMCFLEDQFFSILDEPRASQLQKDHLSTASFSAAKAKRGQSFGRSNEQPDHCLLPRSPEAAELPFPAYKPEAVARMHAIASSLISAGYDIECCQVFTIARCNSFNTTICFEKVSIDEVQRMAWDLLEAEITKWINTFRFTITDAFPHERDLCNKVFASHTTIASTISRSITRSATIQLLIFPEAVAMTKHSAEKIFKVLDMYEAIQDMMPLIGQSEVNDDSSTESDLRSEIMSVKSLLGEAAVAIFCDLEGSIRSDTGKTPVPSGAVHPLIRYAMNYLKYACEYKNPLEQCFSEHQKVLSTTPTFADQLLVIMQLLNSSIEMKSKLYKDLALSNIFMMNNVRYIAQKTKGSPDMKQLLGETWCRRWSSEVRQYHKNYQRETWARVLACFKDDGLMVKGSVQKPVLKERFKMFNAMFEEIHKVQSSWVVSDEQLQSELRVSVSAVVVPAYRSFLGRFGQYLDPGRQTEKYVKFGVDDLETWIDELFDGNQASMVKRRI